MISEVLDRIEQAVKTRVAEIRAATCDFCGGDNNLKVHVPSCPFEQSTNPLEAHG